MPKRLSEFSYTGEDADPDPLHIVSGDEEFFRILNPDTNYQLLPGSWVCALAGRTYYRSADHRMTRLSRAPHRYLIRHKQDRRIAKDSVYQRANNADEHMAKEHGEKRPNYQPDPYAHRLLEDMVQASIELGVNYEPVAIKRWYHGEKVDAIEWLTRQNKALKLERIPNSSWLTDDIHADGDKYVLSDETNHIHFVKEICRSRNKNKNIQRFKHYKNYFNTKDAKQIVLVIAKNEPEMNELKNCCAEAFGTQTPWQIGFTWWCDPWNDKRIPKPTDTMLTRPYQRINRPDAYLNQLWDIKK